VRNRVDSRTSAPPGPAPPIESSAGRSKDATAICRLASFMSTSAADAEGSAALPSREAVVESMYGRAGESTTGRTPSSKDRQSLDQSLRLPRYKHA
jgi:hypothetical protein